MIATEKDDILSKLTVRLRNNENQNIIGTGILYYDKTLKDKVYILTAAHCLFEDSNNFKEKIESIKVDLYNSSKNRYESILIDKVEDNFIIKNKDKDVAVIVIDKTTIEKILGEIPIIEAVNVRGDNSNFVVKGFPNATQGNELDVVYPIWKQKMTEVHKFQLELTESYSSWNTQGFSGSGAFLIANNTIYLYGLFTRYRAEEKGKVIYCQYISLINQLLTNNFLPNISFAYIGSNGLSSEFFKNHIKKSVVNLGPRFNEKLNFKLPIAKLFNDLSFDKNFKNRFYKVIDKWLLERIYDDFLVESNLKHIDDLFFNLKDRVELWAKDASMTIENPINIDWIIKDIKGLDLKIDKENRKLRDLQYEEIKKIREKNKTKKKKEYNHDLRPYEKEINRLRKISRVNNELLFNLENKINIHLSNNPVLIIDGEAGAGKSHLLGDISNEKLKNGVPTILLLGQHFVAERSIENNIIHLLDINCSFDELINSLNGIGKQIGTRVLILIDAINEGAGAKLWRDQIQGLISTISDKLYIGLAITIRTTYLKAIISDEMRNNKNITFKTHLGFKGNEYAALKMFCGFYKLKQPNFPILAPEFTNPLFLKIISQGVNNSATKEFPKGFQGIKNIFDLFIDAIDKKLQEKREEYKDRNIVIKVINKLSFKIFKNSYKRLPLDEVFEIMNDKFPLFKHLLSDLIEEGIFIKNNYKDYETDKNIEVLYFAYERFGDFYIAEELIKSYKLKKDVKKIFNKDTELGKLLTDSYFSHNGVLEALSVLLPEKFNLEIFEVYDWVYEELSKLKSLKEKKHSNKTHIYYNLSSWIDGFFLHSLNWRTIKSIDNNKITKWLKKDSGIDNDDWFLKLVELSAIKNHPLNSDRLYNILSRISMAERDSFWQKHLRFFHGYNDDNNGFPIKRLIDWAWSIDITKLIDEETARLCGQTLAWVLSSTNRTLRDQTTKALVNLLVKHPKALISIIKSFEKNDDLYIRERLYAVAYGCTLRTNNNESIKILSQYVYDSIFKLGNPPKHILLRDYSRNLIEYAIYKNLKIDYDLKLLRPPYLSDIPTLPTENDIAKYKIDYKSPEFKKKYGHTFNGIYFSVIEWDFGDKTVDPELNHFSPISFITKKKYEKFKKKLKKSQKSLIKSYKKTLIIEDKYKESKLRMIDNLGEDNYNQILNDLKKFKDKFLEIAGDEFKKNDLFFLTNTIIPYLKKEVRLKNDRYWSKLDSMPFRRWIVKRVFELGYSMELHGDFDENLSRYDRESAKIGTKYQWIALHEILAIISDNYKIESSYHNEKYDFYKGTWQLYTRDIDPVSITKTNDEYEIDDDFEEVKIDDSWWSEIKYNYWNKSNIEWSESIEDLPKPKDVIIKTDNDGDDWVFLEYRPSWEEPKKIGEEKYMSDKKRLTYFIQGYLVKKEEESDIVNYLKDKNFDGGWLPTNDEGYVNLFNREKFWSPAYIDTNNKAEWVEICDNETRIYKEQKIIISTTSAKGSIDDDKSGANFKYDIPCKIIFEGLNLEYSNIDGDFIDKKGETIVTNINTKGTLIRKKELIEFLDKNDLSIVWKVSGQKIAKSDDRFYHFGVPCGVFILMMILLRGI